MNIERFTKIDLSSLSELFRQFWGEHNSLEKMQATYSKLAINPSYILLAAKQSARLVGFAIGIICEELYGDCRPFMVIEEMFTASS